MIGPIASAAESLRRLRSHSGSTGGRPTLTRMLLDEVRDTARDVLRPVQVLSAVLVGLGLAALLGPVTPGPVVPLGWRLGLAASLALLAVPVAHRLLRRTTTRPASADAAPGTQGDGVLDGLRVVLASTSLLVCGTLLVTSLVAAFVRDGRVATEGLIGVPLAIDRPLLVGGLLLMAALLVAGLSAVRVVPASLLLLGLAMAIGPGGLRIVTNPDPAFVQGLAILSLVVILFEAGLTMDLATLRVGIGPGLLLATVGVGITVTVVALAGGLLGLAVPTAWLVGATVASTDAAAVGALLRRVEVPNRIRAILVVESGLNDPVAVLLTGAVLFASSTDVGGLGWYGIHQMIGGLAVGGAAGWVLGRLLAWPPVAGEALRPVVALVGAGLTYAVAAVVGTSAFLAVFVAGSVVALVSRESVADVRSFHQSLARGVEVGLFLLLGVLVTPSELVDVLWVGLALATVQMLVARPLATAASLFPLVHGPREVAAISWLGARGGVPIVLATIALTAGYPEAEAVLDIVLCVVVVSALVQALTARGVMARLQPPPVATPREATVGTDGS